MTSPNRETEAQQVEPRVEQAALLIKVKTSLKIKRGQIRRNLVLEKTTTDQEQAEMVMLKISKPDRQEMVTAVTSGQEQAETAILKISKPDHQETEKTAIKADHQEMGKAVSGLEQAEMVILKILNQDHQETGKAVTKADHQKMATAVSDLKQAETVTAALNLEVREVQADHQVSNHAHLKKAVLKKCQEMKAAVI